MYVYEFATTHCGAFSPTTDKMIYFTPSREGAASSSFLGRLVREEWCDDMQLYMSTYMICEDPEHLGSYMCTTVTSNQEQAGVLSGPSQ